MDRRKLDNKTLDMIGRKLIECETTSPVDIERIVSNPDLFSMISARIGANAETPARTRRLTGGTFLLRRNVFAYASFAVLLAGAIGLAAVLWPGKALNDVSSIQVPEAEPEVARPEVPPNPSVGKLSEGRAQNREIRPVAKVVNASFRQPVRQPRMNVEIESAGEFVALSSTGEQDEDFGGGRIIRVDLKRSSLIAMGVNLPLENDSEMIKTDLLVGSNGVPRAFRVIK